MLAVRAIGICLGPRRDAVQLRLQRISRELQLNRSLAAADWRQRRLLSGSLSHMKILMISALAAVAFALVGTAGILRSNSHSINVGTAGMPTMQELHSYANVDKLPAEDFEDRSLEYPRETWRSTLLSGPFVSLTGP